MLTGPSSTQRGYYSRQLRCSFYSRRQGMVRTRLLVSRHGRPKLTLNLAQPNRNNLLAQLIALILFQLRAWLTNIVPGFILLATHFTSAYDKPDFTYVIK